MMVKPLRSDGRPRAKPSFFENFGRPAAPRSIKTLVAGSEGAVAVIFAVTASMMIGTLCTAIDTIDFAQTQSRMQMALDVATLSAGANLSHYATTSGSDLSNWQADARAFYNANMPGGYMGLTMPDANFTATVSGAPATGQTIKLSASGSVPLYAPVIFGNNKSSSGSGSGSGSGSNQPTSQTINASNTAVRVPKSTLELVMVLDNTGSMADYASSNRSQGSKLDGLKNAAQTFVTNIFGVSGNDSYIGLVPFTTMVNVGTALNGSGSWMSQSTATQFAYNTTGMSMSAWGGCAVEPHDAAGNVYPKAYAPKSSPGFTPFYYNVPKSGFTVTTYDGTNKCGVTDTKTYKGVPMSYISNGNTSYCSSTTTPQPANYWGQVPYKYATTYSWDQNGSDSGSNRPCSIQPAVFLTKDTNALGTAISNMQANGSTLIPTGLLWGWRMLSSDWSNAISNNNGWTSTDKTLPRPETTQGLQRVAIILTDGENDPGGTTGVMPPPYFNQISGVGNMTLNAPGVGTNGQTLNGTMSDPDDINTFQLGVCSAMKSNGIIIYAITFGTYGTDSASVAAQNTMQNCATSGNYYHAPDNATLNQIFQQIAGNLGVLRLTQ